MKAPSPAGRSPPGAIPAPSSSSSPDPAKSARQSMNAAWPALVGGTRRISVGIEPSCHPPRSAASGSGIEHQAPAADGAPPRARMGRSEEHTSELQSRGQLVCRLLLEKKKLLMLRARERVEQGAVVNG